MPVQQDQRCLETGMWSPAHPTQSRFFRLKSRAHTGRGLILSQAGATYRKAYSSLWRWSLIGSEGFLSPRRSGTTRPIPQVPGLRQGWAVPAPWLLYCFQWRPRPAPMAVPAADHTPDGLGPRCAAEVIAPGLTAPCVPPRLPSRGPLTFMWTDRQPPPTGLLGGWNLFPHYLPALLLPTSERLFRDQPRQSVAFIGFLEF